MGKGRVRRRLHELHGAALPRLLRHAHKALPLAKGILKQDGGVFVPQKRHRDAACLLQSREKDPFLHLIKIRKTVKIHILAHQVRGLRQRIPQLLHPRACVPSVGAETGVIGGIQQRHVPQLVPLLPDGLLHAGIQLLRRDLICIQLVHQRDQLLQKRRAA